MVTEWKYKVFYSFDFNYSSSEKNFPIHSRVIVNLKCQFKDLEQYKAVKNYHYTYIATPRYQRHTHHQWRHPRPGGQGAIHTLVTKCCYPRLAVKSKSRNFSIEWILTLLPGPTTKEWFQIYTMSTEIPRKSMVNTAKLRQIFPLRENTLRHVVEGDGRYPRAMTPSNLFSEIFIVEHT